MVTITHVDTCYPEYLLDHHNRPGELLIGIPVGSEGSLADLLLEEMNACDFGFPEWIPDEEIRAACAGLDVDLSDHWQGERDGSDDLPCVWLLLKWKPRLIVGGSGITAEDR